MKIGLLFNQPLGAQIAPIGNFAPKRIAPAVAAGLIAGGSALAAGVGNLVSQASTNNANKEINRENLAWQREQWKQQQENFKLQRKWQLEDTASERYWNSVASQVARYRAAGLNPSLAMYGGAGQNQVQTGTVSPSAPSGSYSGQQLQMQPLNFEGFGIAGQTAANTYLSYQRNETDMAVAKQHANNETLDTMSKLIQRGFQNQHFKALAEQIALQTKFENENWSERSRALKVANDEIVANQKYVEAKTKYQDLLNEFTPKEQRAILREFEAKYNEIQSSIRKNDAEAAESAARKALHEAEKKGVDINNEVADQLVESRISMGHYEEDQAYWNSRNARKEAGTLKKGVGPYTVEERDRDEAAVDPDHRRVQYDRRGRKYIFDSKTNKRIYID